MNLFSGEISQGTDQMKQGRHMLLDYVAAAVEQWCLYRCVLHVSPWASPMGTTLGFLLIGVKTCSLFCSLLHVSANAYRALSNTQVVQLAPEQQVSQGNNTPAVLSRSKWQGLVCTCFANDAK